MRSAAFVSNLKPAFEHNSKRWSAAAVLSLTSLVRQTCALIRTIHCVDPTLSLICQPLRPDSYTLRSGRHFRAKDLDAHANNHISVTRVG